ncbi:MAG: PD40 domain-containing protein [Chloroflexi bacterium]|nr:PD40 domain-containing protein [Chloroflexota bacterium]
MNKFLLKNLTLVCIIFLGTGCINQNYANSAPIESTLPVIHTPSSTTSSAPLLLPTLTPIPSKTPFPFDTLTGKIAFAGRGVDKSNGFIYHSIGIADANGQNMRYLVKAYGNELVFSPTWSPDGSYLAYTSVEIDYARENIFIANVDGNQTERLKTGNQSVSGLSWSPDGNQIAYSGDIGTQSDIFIINPFTKTIKQFAYSSFPEGFPSWSPDGKQIAYLQFDLPKHGNGAHLYVMDTSGQNKIQVEGVLASQSRISWSPDGKQIAFRSNDGCGDIYTVELDGGNLHQISNLPGGEKDPVWSPDGKYLIFAASDFVCDLSTGGEPLYAHWQPYLINSQGGEPINLPLASDSNIFNFSWLPEIITPTP